LENWKNHLEGWEDRLDKGRGGETSQKAMPWAPRVGLLGGGARRPKTQICSTSGRAWGGLDLGEERERGDGN
jgi:hypothetical protein